MLPFALLSLAHATPAMDVACGFSSVQVTAPAPLATGVPIDVLPAALLTTGDCGATTWDVLLLDAASGSEVASLTYEDSDGPVLELDPGADLEPDTTYTFRLTPEGGSGEITEIGFTTGEGTAAELDGVPTIGNARASWSGDTEMVSAQALLGAAADADGSTFLAFAEEGGEDQPLDIEVVSGAVSQTFSGTFSAPQAPENVCLVATQRDLAGRWSTSDPTCVTPDIQRASAGVCGTTGSAPLGLLSVLLAAAGLARRRS